MNCHISKSSLLLAFSLAAGAAVADPEHTYLEKDGIVLFNIEDAEYVEGWELKTDLPAFKGQGYLEWRGENFIPRATAGNAVMTFHFRIVNAGNYELRFRNYIAEGDVVTEHNDSWARMDTGVNVPGEEPLNGWAKVYTSTGGQWTWQSRTVDNGGRQVRQYFSAGDHTLEIAARSRGHAIDMITLYQYDGTEDNNGAIDSWELSEVVTGDGTIVTPGEYPDTDETGEGDGSGEGTGEGEGDGTGEGDGETDIPTNIETPRVNLDPANDSWVAIDNNMCVMNTLALPAIDSAVFNPGDVKAMYITDEIIQVSSDAATVLLNFDLSNVPPFNALTLEYETEASASASLDYSLASHSSWSSTANAENSTQAPGAMLLLGTASGGWQANKRHRSSLSPILVSSSGNTVLMHAQPGSDPLSIYSHQNADQAPRLLISGDGNFCSDWQANVDAAEAQVEVPSEETETTGEIDVKDTSDKNNPAEPETSSGSLSFAGFLALMLVNIGRLARRQRPVKNS